MNARKVRIIALLGVLVLAALLLILAFGKAEAVSASEPALTPTPKFDDNEVYTTPAPNGTFVINTGQIGAVWWKACVDGNCPGDCTLIWLWPGNYQVQSPGRIRIWTLPTDVMDFKAWWLEKVQTEANGVCTYTQMDLGMPGAINYGDLEVQNKYVQKPNGSFTIPSGELGVTWWKPTVNGTLYDGCFGIWLYPGTYQVFAPEGAMRVYNISSLSVADVENLKTWWQGQVQSGASFCTYTWFVLGK